MVAVHKSIPIRKMRLAKPWFELSLYKNKEYFAIIIGSGPAGLSTAIGLEQKKIECLIIEAGGLNPNINNELYLNGKFFGDSDYETISHSRGRQFGGTGNFWGGNCNPIQEKEFNDWPIKKKKFRSI